MDDREFEKHPMLMYTAINVRSQLAAVESGTSSTFALDHFHLALGYLNLVFPSFIPRRTSSRTTEEQAKHEEAIFWHRARSVKKQHAGFVKQAIFGKRTIGVYKDRAARATQFAQEDDAADPRLRYAAWEEGREVPTAAAKSNSVVTTGPQQLDVSRLIAKSGHGPSPLLPKAPSLALLGLSLIGDLDRIYERSAYGPITLHNLIPSYRKNKGGMLVACRTLAGSMTVNLVLDVEGFDRPIIEEFWDNIRHCVREYMVGEIRARI